MSEPDGPPAEPLEPERGGAPVHRLDPDRAAREHRLDPDRAAREHRLDPDRAAVAEGEPVLPVPSAGIDTRRYRWMIGIFGLVLVAAISIYQFATHGVGTTGVPPGQRLHFFAAPLAASTLNGDPNLSPPCTPARHDPRALNLCLIVAREPVVLAFFVTGSGDCERQVDALQAMSAQFPANQVEFAAVAIHASRKDTAALARARHWTIPIAYDRDGSVGALYGVAICPMVELAYRGGIVKDRLLGNHWIAGGALAPRVRALLANPSSGGRPGAATGGGA